MTTREKLQIVFEIVTLPFMIVWKVIDGFFFVPGRIERELKKSNRIYRRS